MYYWASILVYLEYIPVNIFWIVKKYLSLFVSG